MLVGRIQGRVMWESFAAELVRREGILPVCEIIACIPGAEPQDLVKLLGRHRFERHHYGESSKNCHLEYYFDFNKLPAKWRKDLRNIVKKRDLQVKIDRLHKLYNSYKFTYPKKPKRLHLSNMHGYLTKLRSNLDKELAKVRKINKRQ